MEIEFFLKIFLAALLGGIIGLEREISHKEAGLRTNILIAIGSTFFTILSLKIAGTDSLGDPSRMPSQIITGIGFLGAGAIIHSRFMVHGLTTAATIWTVAAIGIGVGSGFYLLSLMVTLFVVTVLTVFKIISKSLDKQKKTFLYLINTEDRAAVLVEIKKILLELGIKYQSFNLKRRKKGLQIEFFLTISDNKDKELLERIMQLKHVSDVVHEHF